MDDKFILMGLNDERSVKVAEVLKNKTCKKMINHLGDVKEASEKDISDACGIPMNTVGYNLKNLIEVGLVEKTKNFFWSVKGKKIKMYKLAKKHIIISPSKKPSLSSLKGILPVILLAFVVLALASLSLLNLDNSEEIREEGFFRFESGSALIKAFEDTQGSNRYGGEIMFAEASKDSSVPSAQGSGDYSETNIQVAGVDEADIIKTDGKYIYAVVDSKLIIALAYPSDKAEIVSETEFEDFYGSEIFIEDDKLMVFGRENHDFRPSPGEPEPMMASGSFAPERYPSYMSTVSVKLYDISDRSSPELLRTLDFEGNYLTSRKIGSEVYFVINSYPNFYDEGIGCEEIVPLYREGEDEMKPIVLCTDVGYINPIQAQNFLTLVSVSIDDEDKEINKEVIVGNGQNVYASLENLYIAQTSWPVYNRGGLIDEDRNVQQTVITKFELDKGKIKFAGTGEVRGHILNQFSMEEYKDNFRIATTTSDYSSEGSTSVNNVYVLNKDLELIGELEDLAPGERIYSVRFMGEKGYVVTFKKVDPLFVIDLSDASNPSVLGKLKIPGYSDYLHPYDENHIIGIGKDTVEAEADLIERRNLDFAWYQGIKMAIFDVSDVENPIETHKVVIGDRGTDSEALHNHKAFLFDKEKELLVLPITLAEIKGEKTRDNQYGEFTFQGAYVYNINLEDGFELRGKITHYDDDSAFKKSGYYFRGDSQIRRSLYIGNVLYTFSPKKIKMNLLDNLNEIKELVF